MDSPVVKSSAASAGPTVRHRFARTVRRQLADCGRAGRGQGNVRRHAQRIGRARYPGAKLGSETDWIPLFADNGGYGAFIEHFVYSRNTPNFDWRRELNFSNVYDEAKSKLTPFSAAPSPDITAFVRRGGKLLHFHGWNDPVVTPDGSIDYLYALTQFERFRNLPKAEFDRAVDSLTARMSRRRPNRYSKRFANTIGCSWCPGWVTAR